MFSTLPKIEIIIYVTLFCHLQMLSIWTRSNFCCLGMVESTGDKTDPYGTWQGVLPVLKSLTVWDSIKHVQCIMIIAGNCYHLFTVIKKFLNPFPNNKF